MHEVGPVLSLSLLDCRHTTEYPAHLEQGLLPSHPSSEVDVLAVVFASTAANATLGIDWPCFASARAGCQSSPGCIRVHICKGGHSLLLQQAQAPLRPISRPRPRLRRKANENRDASETPCLLHIHMCVFFLQPSLVASFCPPCRGGLWLVCSPWTCPSLARSINLPARPLAPPLHGVDADLLDIRGACACVYLYTPGTRGRRARLLFLFFLSSFELPAWAPSPSGEV